MSDLQNIALKAIKSNLGELEIKAFESVIADSKELKSIKDKYKTQKELDDKRIGELEAENRKLGTRLTEAEGLNGASEQVRLKSEQAIQRCAITEAKAEIYQEDRTKLFGIVAGAYKHYTQTTTRREVVGGGDYVEHHTDMNGNGYGVTSKAPDYLQDVVETKSSE